MSECGSEGESASSAVGFMSAESDNSKEYPPFFSSEPKTSQTRFTEVKKMSGSERGSASSTVSRVSMRSDSSKEYPPFFSSEPKTSQTRNDYQEALRFADYYFKKMSESKGGSASSTVSRVSMRSDSSKEYPPFFSSEPKTSQTSGQNTSGIQQNQDTLRVFESKAMAFVKKALKTHQKVLSAKHQGLFVEDEQDVAHDDEQVESDDETKEAALKIALHILRTMNEDEHVRTLQQSHYGAVAMYQKKLRSSLKKKNQYILEDITKQSWPVPLEKIYTKLYLIEGDSGQVNNEHEVRQIERAFNKMELQKSETVIKCRDIFKPLPKCSKQIRTVLTKGIAGIGKTVLAQKFILDWSEEKANQDIQLLFSLPFRELNLLQNEKRSLMELLYDFSPGLKKSEIKELETSKVLFVLDGLDECRLPLDFERNERCCDATQSASVDVLLTNLIAGKLLPQANLWITSRPAAASCIPRRYVDRVTEIRGFNNKQKEQYFYKKIDDENLARRVIANIKSTRSLHIMCHVPVFCWISSIVLGEMCAEAQGGKMPKTLTQMYIHFVAHQTKQSHVKYGKEHQLDCRGNNEVILSLGKLAFMQLEKGNLIFYEDDLTDCGIDVKEASVYSGVCTQVFREESCMQKKVFCFVHLSVQEFLAALYVHVMYKVKGVNLMVENRMVKTKSVSELHKAAVDRALKCDNGQLDLFLRFLLGLSLDSSQSLLKGMKIVVDTCDSQSLEETIEYIKGKISPKLGTEKFVNLFHCLNELNDHSLVEEIQSRLDSDRDMMMDGCSAAQWATLGFVLLTSTEKSEEIQLKKYSRTEEGLLKLLPVIKASRSAMLNDCNLTAICCEKLASALSSSSNELNHLNLSDNNLQDSGIELLCSVSGLRSPHCRLKMLRLNRCGLTQKCCVNLASVLSCPSSYLRELDLSNNDIADLGLQQLSNGLGNTCCKLETLRLSFCNITEEGCGYLAMAVTSNPSHLSELDLSYNHLGESGVKLISKALEEGRCELTRLRVDHNAQHWFKSGLREYAREVEMDPNTAHKLLVLSENNHKVVQVSKEQPYEDHPDRFDYWVQVVSKEGLEGRCYWEMEWEGTWVAIGVTYKGISRKGTDNDCVMGYNRISWSLHCHDKGYRAYHNFESIVLRVPQDRSRGLAVYLDSDAGILSFYRVSSGRSLTHLHTFYTEFTEPLYPVFRVWGKDSSLKLCRVK